MVVEFLLQLTILQQKKSGAESSINGSQAFATSIHDATVVWTFISHGFRPIRERETDKM